MIQIKFKNLEKSQLASEAALERIEGLILKFPDLAKSHVQLTLEMQNSPFQAGPDLFKIKLCTTRGRYTGIVVEKEDANLYVALAELTDDMLEVLNRFGDRERVKRLKQARTFVRELKKKSVDHDKAG
ncbi:MAG: hypothetical protein ACK5P7_05340 [Bdellovibrio sp.]|jgi:hypothetical protein